MKEKKQKKIRRLWPFATADYEQANAYLEKQAEKGLILESLVIYNFVAVFRKDRPQKRKFCVDGFKGTEEEAEEYLTMAEDAGWTAVAVSQGLIIFMSEENASPALMQTDWEQSYRWIRKSLWKFDIPMGIVLAALLIILFWQLPPWELRWPPEGFQAWNLIVLSAATVFALLGFARAIVFYIRSERALRTGAPMQDRGSSLRRAMLWGYLRSGAGIAWWLAVLGRFLEIAVPDLLAGGTKAFWLTSIIVCLALLFITVRISWEKRPELGKGIIVVLCILLTMVFLGYCATGSLS